MSLVFATFNGAGTLPTMLNCLASLNLRGIDLEIIAVDNGSTDGSRKLLVDAAGRLPIQVISEPARGKNKALNRAIASMQGDLVVLTDDDVMPVPQWLQVFMAAAVDHPAHDLFGGKIVPKWPRPPEDWIVQGVPLGAAFGVSDPDWAAGDIHPSRVWGANMMVRRSVFAAGHRFSEEVGPAKGSYIMGSETEFNKRIFAAGHRSCFVPAAEVGHIIREHQLSTDWLTGRAFRYGRSLCAAELPLVRQQAATLLGLPRWQVREYLACHGRALAARWAGNRTEVMRCLWGAHVSRGYMAQWRTESCRRAIISDGYL